VPRPYLSTPPHRNPPRPQTRPQQPQPPEILFPLGADLVRLIENQIPKITLLEALSVTRCLGDELKFLNNPYISNVAISRNNQEFSRGDSWFSVTWLEFVEHRLASRSVNLRFEPGRGVCTSYEVESNEPSPSIQQIQQPIPFKQELPTPGSEESESPMEVDRPKEVAEWTATVGDLFEQAAGIKNTQSRDHSSPEMSIEEIPVVKMEDPDSYALWPLNMWKAIKAIIYGEEVSTSKKMYSFGVPHGTLNVLVERAQAIVGVFCSDEPKQVNTQQFIHHQPRKKVSLKTIAILLSIRICFIANSRPITSFEG
jgi:hypothetical protein